VKEKNKFFLLIFVLIVFIIAFAAVYYVGKIIFFKANGGILEGEVKNQVNLSFDSIFNYVDPQKASEKNINPTEYTLIATGDVIPARSVNSKLVMLNNFNFPYEKTVKLLRSSDITFINLETPLISDCKPTLEGMIFCGNQLNVGGLLYANVKVASIANNHSGNYGLNGVNSTIKLLTQNNILVTGNSSQSAIVNVRGKKFGFLGYNDIGGRQDGVAFADLSQIVKDIQDLKKTVDFVVVTFHWGTEYTPVPNSSQIVLAHKAIDAGADLIIGNHPHWVQGVEEYKGKFITYAHGNFVFDQMWSKETREGVVGKYTFNNNGLIKIEFIPIVIDDYSQPRFASKEEANAILNKIKLSSQQINKIKLTAE
jgi:poly-gamma-glutamate synthesis protein (capsule biosynthesis protein)